MAREAKKSGGIRWRLWIGGVLIGAVGVSAAVAAVQVRRYVSTDPRFLLSRDRKDALTIEGVVHTSRWRVNRIFAEDFNRSVFSVPLEERRRRLLAIDWIEDASVSRIWPDRLIVRIRERKPVAFAHLRAGVQLIDAHGVLLDPPAKAQFGFPVLSGIREDETEAQRAVRVRILLRLEEELGQGFRQVSEVNVADPDNVHLVTQVDKRAVELVMGEGEFARRYQNFVTHYPEIWKRSPDVKVFDLRLDDRITAKE